MELPKENKYACKSLRTHIDASLIKKVKCLLKIYVYLKQGKTYFSITTKKGVKKYLSFRLSDVELGHIVKRRQTKALKNRLKRKFRSV